MTLILSMLASDLQQTQQFYVDILGFGMTGEYPEQNPTWIEVQFDEACLQFYSEPPVNTLTSPALSGTIYFKCDDVSATFERIKSHVDVLWPPELMDYGQYEFGIKDPNGYILAFYENR